MHHEDIHQLANVYIYNTTIKWQINTLFYLSLLILNSNNYIIVLANNIKLCCASGSKHSTRIYDRKWQNINANTSLDYTNANNESPELNRTFIFISTFVPQIKLEVLMVKTMTFLFNVNLFILLIYDVISLFIFVRLRFRSILSDII